MYWTCSASIGGVTDQTSDISLPWGRHRDLVSARKCAKCNRGGGGWCSSASGVAGSGDEAAACTDRQCARDLPKGEP